MGSHISGVHMLRFLISNISIRTSEVPNWSTNCRTDLIEHPALRTALAFRVQNSRKVERDRWKMLEMMSIEVLRRLGKLVGCLRIAEPVRNLFRYILVVLQPFKILSKL